MLRSVTEPRRRRLRRTLAAAVLVGVVSFGAAACSTPAPSQDQLTSALVDSGISRKVADCTAKALTGSLSESELAELTERGAGGAPVDDTSRTGDSYDKLTAAMAKCRELQIASEPTTTTTVAGGGSGSSLVEPSTDGAQLNPASSTTTAP